MLVNEEIRATARVDHTLQKEFPVGMLGLPNPEELASMFGYVDENDRAQWEQKKAASDARLEQARNRLSGRGLATHAAGPAMGMAERSINAELSAARHEEARNTLAKERKTTTTTITREEPVSSDSHGWELG